MSPVYFAVPGNIETLTGGYAYDRRLLSGLQSLGMPVVHMALPDTFPRPDADALATTDALLAALPDGATVLIDGLAYGVMDDMAVTHHRRLRLIALCHHPLALEAGLSAAEAASLRHSEQRALEQAAAVIVTSPATAGILAQQFGVPQERITVAPPGTDRQPFAPCTGDPPVLLTVATLTRRKAHDVLIAALARVAHLPWVARFVGGHEFDPEWVAVLRQQVARLNLEQRIQFVGSVADPRAEYAAADLFVLPSLYEGYGMVFAEALAFGLPVVATRTGAVPELVPDTAGLIVPPGNVAALAAAIERLLHGATGLELRAHMQQGAQAAASRLPTWNETARRVATLIESVRSQ